MAKLTCGTCDGDWWEVRHLIQTDERYVSDSMAVGAVPLPQAERVALVCVQCGERIGPNPNATQPPAAP